MKYSLQEILSLTLDIAERMIKCGAEVSRVEESMRIIFKGYKVKYYEVYAINTLLIATLRDDKNVVTEARRVRYNDTDFLQLENINTLSREICKNNKSRKQVLKELQAMKEDKNTLSLYIGQLLVAFFFTLFYGGKVIDAICALVVTSFLFLLNYYVPTKKTNKIIYNFLASFVIGIFSVFSSRIFPIINSDKVIIGNIMLLIPGLSIFLSIYDIFKGDTISGTTRFIEGIFLALAIAGGIGASLLIGGLL